MLTVDLKHVKIIGILRDDNIGWFISGNLILKRFNMSEICSAQFGGL